MPPLRTIGQKQFLKGVNASVSYNSQPKGTVARISNMTLNTRGALRSCDQNLGICTLNGAGPLTNGTPFLSLQFFQPSPTSRKILALGLSPTGSLSTPTGLAAALASGGSLTSGTTYYYKVTAVDSAGGETIASAEVNATPSGGNLTVDLSWTAVTGAVSYNVYRSTTSGGEFLLQGTGLPATTNSYADNGSATVAAGGYTIVSASYTVTYVPPQYPYFPGGSFYSVVFETSANVPSGTYTSVVVSGVSNAFFNTTWPGLQSNGGKTLSFSGSGGGTNQTGTGGSAAIPGGGISPPTSNSSQQLELIDVSGLSFTRPGSVIFNFPPGSIVPMPAFPVGSAGGSQSGQPGGGTAVNPAAGNIAGQASVLPDMVPFVSKIILALGNGYAPYKTDGTAGGTVALANTFSAAFPNWIASTPYAVGDIIIPATPNGHTYKCVQAGTSGSSTPTFPTGSGATVADGAGIIWQENGSSAVPAPRGAAHAISHAGSLWLWNTSPTNSTDNLDGPSILKMSDANNPDSWNPINVAFVGKDDGQQGMGMASFTIAESGIAPEGTLVLFKEFSTYQVIGVFGASDFAIQKAQTDLGCIAPRSVKFVPGFGIMRLTHLGVAVFDGVRDRLISEEIRPYLFGGVYDIVPMDQSYCYLAKGDLVAVPPMYVLAIPVIGSGNNGSLTRLCCYDLVLKAWTIIDLPFGIEALRQLNIPGSLPMTTFGGWSDDMISRWQVGDQQGWQAWLDTSLVIHQGTKNMWSFRTPAALGAEASDRVFFRRLLVRGTWQGTTYSGSTQPLLAGNSTGTESFSVAVATNYETPSPPISPPRKLLTFDGDSLDSSFILNAELGITSLDLYANISGTQKLGGAPVEIVETDWLAVPRPIGSLVRV